jgi:glycosyltransferase involved in cell wall biosynthesis
MAMALPCVATNRGGMPELLDGGQVGLLVPPHQPEALAEAILALARNPERARALGDAARRRAVEHYSLQEYEQKLWTIYQGLGAGG